MSSPLRVEFTHSADAFAWLYRTSTPDFLMSQGTMPSAPPPAPKLPALWYEPAPQQFDLRVPAWLKILILVVATVLAILFVDKPLAVWASRHAIPDLGYHDGSRSKGDIGRELMWLEQFGQVVCTASVVAAVYLLDRQGRRRALSIVIGCVLTLVVTHLLKDLIGRTRPFLISPDGSWSWGGPPEGFSHGSASFPSAHTTAAFALASGLAWFYPRGRLLFMGLAIVTATQRVLHTAHYLSDTLAGMTIGVFVMRSVLAAKIPGRLIALGPPWAQQWWLSEK